MSDKVIWLEGMVLSPHHFQQAGILDDQSNAARAGWLSGHAYGLAALEIDHNGLDTGFFGVREVAGVFPDGTPFHCPTQDGGLDARPFDTYFPPGKEKLDVYLALPSLSIGGANYSPDGRADGRPVRYQASIREIPDVNTGVNARRLTLGRLNLRLLFEGETLQGFQNLKIAELRRDLQNRVVLDEGFIPTCIRIQASSQLMSALKKLADNALQKSGYLMGQRAQKSGGMAQYTAEAVTSYLLLSSINSNLPELLHDLKQPIAHPESIFRKLLRMAGSLASFGAETRMNEWPSYTHGDLRTCFFPLIRLIEALLGASVPTGFRVLQLTRTSPIQYAANLRELDLQKLKGLYLGVNAQAGEMEILQHVQRRAKVGPMQKLEALVANALPGIGLVPEAQPPSGIPAKAGYKYFRVHPAGEYWDQVAVSRALAIHMPGDLPGIKLELIATVES